MKPTLIYINSRYSFHISERGEVPAATLTALLLSLMVHIRTNKRKINSLRSLIGNARIECDGMEAKLDTGSMSAEAIYDGIELLIKRLTIELGMADKCYLLNGKEFERKVSELIKEYNSTIKK